MTISTNRNDERNKDWTSYSKMGAKLLQKMGWKEGEGVGKHRDGEVHALKGIRRTDSLGLGAATHHGHSTESSGWKDTTESFSSVLAGLQQHHGGASSGGESDSVTKKEKKLKKRKKSKSKSSRTLTLATNKVNAGHAQKMRNAKSLANKTAEEMACIFGSSQSGIWGSSSTFATATSAAHPKGEDSLADSSKSKKRKRKRTEAVVAKQDGDSEVTSKQNDGLGDDVNVDDEHSRDDTTSNETSARKKRKKSNKAEKKKKKTKKG